MITETSLSLLATPGGLAKTDHLFAGWAAAPDGYTGFGSNEISGTRAITTGENRVYAVWVPKVQKVKRKAALLEDGSFFLLDETSAPLLTGVADFEESSMGSPYWLLALMDNGSLRSWGDNSAGQLGIGSYSSVDEAPVDITGLTGTPVKMVLQYQTAYVLTDAGNLYGWGKDTGPLSPAGSGQYVASPEELLSGVSDFSAGSNFAAAVLDTGGIQTAGLNGYGQLGDGTTVDRDTFGPTDPAAAGVEKIVSGYHHTLALTEDGTLLGFGYDRYDQLGELGFIDSQVTAPTQITTGVTDVFARRDVSFVITAAGEVFSTGYEALGGLGRTLESWEAWLEVPLFFPEAGDVADIAPVFDRTSYILTEGGDLYFCGKIPTSYSSPDEPPTLLEENVGGAWPVDDWIRILLNDGSYSTVSQSSTNIFVRSYP